MSIRLQVLNSGGDEICTAFRADREVLRERDWRVANSYWCPVGPYHGKAWVLCSKTDAEAIKSVATGIKLKFSSNQGSVTCSQFTFLKARKIIASAVSSVSLYMVELGDKRIEFSRKYGNCSVPFAKRVQSANVSSATCTTDFVGTSGNAVTINGSYVPGLKCRLSSYAHPRGPLDDAMAREQAIFGAWMVYDPHTGTYLDPVPFGDTSGVIDSDAEGTPVFSEEVISDIQTTEITTMTFVVPLYHTRLGSDSNYTYDASEYESRLCAHTKVSVDWGAGGVPHWDTELGLSGEVEWTPNRLCLPFYGTAIYDPFEYAHGSVNSITNRDAINHDLEQISLGYLIDSTLDFRHKIHDGFHRITPGSYVKSVVWRARDGRGSTEWMIHPGMPGDYHGELQAGMAWSEAFQALSLPSTIDGWRTPLAPVELVEVTADTPDGAFAYAKIRRVTAGLTLGVSDEQDVWAVHVDDTSSWSAPDPGFYLGRLLWEYDDKPVFAVQPQGESTGQDWGWFKGTTTAGMSGAGPHTITLNQMWGGKVVASPVYIWNNPALLRCPSNYSVWGIGQLSGSTWTIDIMQVKHQAAAAWLDPDWGDTVYDSELGTVDGCALSAREPTIAVMANDLLPDIEVQIQFYDHQMVSAVSWDGTELQQTINVVCLPLPKDTDDEVIFTTVEQTVVVGLNLDSDSLNAPRKTVTVFESVSATQDEVEVVSCDAITVLWDFSYIPSNWNDNPLNGYNPRGWNANIANDYGSGYGAE